MNQSQSSILTRVLRVLDRGIVAIERFVLAASVLAMAAVNIANVAGRNLFNHSLIFAEEINQALIVLCTFMGVGFGVRYGRHIRMSAIYDQLRGAARKTLWVIICLATAALLIMLAYYAALYVADRYQVGEVTPALRIPVYLIYVWVPVGLALGGIQYVLAAVRNLVSEGVYMSFEYRETYDEPRSW